MAPSCAGIWISAFFLAVKCCVMRWASATLPEIYSTSGIEYLHLYAMLERTLDLTISRPQMLRLRSLASNSPGVRARGRGEGGVEREPSAEEIQHYSPIYGLLGDSWELFAGGQTGSFSNNRRYVPARLYIPCIFNLLKQKVSTKYFWAFNRAQACQKASFHSSLLMLFDGDVNVKNTLLTQSPLPLSMRHYSHVETHPNKNDCFCAWLLMFPCFPRVNISKSDGVHYFFRQSDHNASHIWTSN